MYLIKTKKSPFYQMVYEVDGKRTSISTRTKYKADAQKFMTGFYRNQSEKNAAQNSVLLSDFQEEYESYILKSKSLKYYKSVVLSLNQLVQHTGNLYLHEITFKKLEDFILTIHGRAASAAHLYYRTLKAAFSKALDWEYIVDNPLKKIKPPKQVHKIPTTLLKKEFDLILNNTSNDDFKRLFIVAFYTGMRLSELVNMKYSWINYGEFLITVKNDASFTSKSKRERIIPMYPKVFIVLSKEELDENEYVFRKYPGIPYSPDHVSKIFKKTVRTSKLNESIHFHTLRHTFASMLARKGVSLLVIQKLMGHSDIKTTQIYSHLQKENLVDAIERL